MALRSLPNLPHGGGKVGKPDPAKELGRHEESG